MMCESNTVVSTRNFVMTVVVTCSGGG